MYLLFWIGALWLAAAVVLTAAFFLAKRSGPLYAWLFGDQSASERRIPRRL